jgi:hypothetical protein
MSSSSNLSQKAIASKIPTYKVSFNRRDLILYALGLGIYDMKFVYEEGEERDGLFLFFWRNLINGENFLKIPIFLHFQPILLSLVKRETVLMLFRLHVI